MVDRPLRLAATVAVLALAACTHAAPGSPDALTGFGPNPQLAAPHKSLLPTIGIPKVVGWPAGAAPKAPPGFVVTRFAEGLDHPRWLHVLPNGDVLVAESASEPSAADQQGIRGWLTKRFMKKAGAVEKSPNQILLLRDADGDGQA